MRASTLPAAGSESGWADPEHDDEAKDAWLMIWLVGTVTAAFLALRPCRQGRGSTAPCRARWERLDFAPAAHDREDRLKIDLGALVESLRLDRSDVGSDIEYRGGIAC